MQPFDQAISRSQESIVSTNKVLKNTYMLLSATLLFSAVMAMVSLFLAVPVWTYYVSLIGGMVMGMFVLPRTANSAAGIGVIFLVTGNAGSLGHGQKTSLWKRRRSDVFQPYYDQRGIN